MRTTQPLPRRIAATLILLGLTGASGACNVILGISSGSPADTTGGAGGNATGSGSAGGGTTGTATSTSSSAASTSSSDSSSSAGTGGSAPICDGNGPVEPDATPSPMWGQKAGGTAGEEGIVITFKGDASAIMMAGTFSDAETYFGGSA